MGSNAAHPIMVVNLIASVALPQAEERRLGAGLLLSDLHDVHWSLKGGASAGSQQKGNHRRAVFWVLNVMHRETKGQDFSMCPSPILDRLSCSVSSDVCCHIGTARQTHNGSSRLV